MASFSAKPISLLWHSLSLGNNSRCFFLISLVLDLRLDIRRYNSRFFSIIFVRNVAWLFTKNVTRAPHFHEREIQFSSKCEYEHLLCIVNPTWISWFILVRQNLISCEMVWKKQAQLGLEQNPMHLSQSSSIAELHHFDIFSTQF